MAEASFGHSLNVKQWPPHNPKRVAQSHSVFLGVFFRDAAEANARQRASLTHESAAALSLAGQTPTSGSHFPFGAHERRLANLHWRTQQDFILVNTPKCGDQPYFPAPAQRAGRT